MLRQGSVYFALVRLATVSVKGVVRVTPPPVPAALRLETPAFAADDAVKVKVLVLAPAPRTVAGEKAAETPLGRPVTARVTAPVNPLAAVAVTVSGAVELGFMLTAVFDRASENGGGTTTFTLMVWVCVMPSPVAEMVRA